MLQDLVVVAVAVAVATALPAQGQGTWDFSRYPTQGQSAPVPVDPSFAQRYNIAGISNTVGLKGTGAPASAPDGVCSVPPTVPAQCDWRCDACNAPTDIPDCGRPGVWGLSIDDGRGRGWLFLGMGSSVAFLCLRLSD